MLKQFIKNQHIQNFLVTVLALVFVIIVLASNVLTGLIPFKPITNIVPQKIESTITVDGLPAFHVGETFVVTSTKCNNLDTLVVTHGESSWVKQNTNFDESLFPHGGTGQLTPGCHTYHFKHLITDEVTLGKWRIEGYDQVQIGSREQNAGWYTDTFVVIP